MTPIESKSLKRECYADIKLHGHTEASVSKWHLLRADVQMQTHSMNANVKEIYKNLKENIFHTSSKFAIMFFR